MCYSGTYIINVTWIINDKMLLEIWRLPELKLRDKLCDHNGMSQGRMYCCFLCSSRIRLHNNCCRLNVCFCYKILLVALIKLAQFFNTFVNSFFGYLFTSVNCIRIGALKLSQLWQQMYFKGNLVEKEIFK